MSEFQKLAVLLCVVVSMSSGGCVLAPTPVTMVTYQVPSLTNPISGRPLDPNHATIVLNGDGAFVDGSYPASPGTQIMFQRGWAGTVTLRWLVQATDFDLRPEPGPPNPDSPLVYSLVFPINKASIIGPLGAQPMNPLPSITTVVGGVTYDWTDRPEDPRWPGKLAIALQWDKAQVLYVRFSIKAADWD